MRNDIDDTELIRLYRDERLSLRGVAAVVGVSSPTVRNRLCKAGVERRTPHVKRIPAAMLEEMRDLYLSGMTLARIAALKGVSSSAVHRRLSLAGVPTRRPGTRVRA